ncbi:MAG TPA: oxygenase MpaB family protein [Nitrospirales bacterium]|nr:oxygenase MpaB family protein [Nitrospirales bacterium]
MARDSILKEIQTLDPQKDHERIVFLSTCYEFSFDTTRALELALFRTFCVPSISGLLDRTGEFGQRTQKRYDDTDILVSELLEWGYSSERGRRAIQRINRLHGRFSIANEDFLYVLSTFLFEPIRWNRRFGWRIMCEQERLGLFYFWRAVGQGMQIQEIPEDYQTFERFNVEYERERFRFTPSNHRVGTATVELFVGWFPRMLAPLVRSAIYALLEPHLIQAFGFPEPSRLIRWAVPSLMELRAGMLRCLPPRRHPRLRTEMIHPSHPRGYVIEQLGPPE